MAARSILHLTLALLVLVSSMLGAAPAHPQGLPPQALILGVPFISWSEARRMDYEQKDILNPSFPAVIGMVLEYWGKDLKLLKNLEEALKPGGWAVVESGKAQSIDDLKPFITQGYPVMVNSAITPVAHPLSPLFVRLATMRGVTFTRGRPQSGTLGEMVPLAAFREVADALNVKPWESLLISERVVIGYDDERQVVILHDPSFGPAWEVTYGDFEKMMKVSKELRSTGYLVIRPAKAAEASASRAPGSPYRPRTPDERAAEHFVYGYALGSVGREADAEEQLRQGLAIPGIRKGYQHLLLLELAVHERAAGHTEDAIATALKAAELVPEHFRSWQFLAQAYRDTSAADSAQKASAAADKVRTLCSDSRALNVVAEVLGRDFFIVGCDPLRLLGGPTH